MQNAEYWIKTLDLVDYSGCGEGYFKEIYRSEESTTDLPERYGNGAKTFGTAIYFLLQNKSFPTFNLMKTDELFHFYTGSPVTIFTIDSESGELEEASIGPEECHKFVYKVPKGRFYAFRLKEPKAGDFALLGVSVSPGFDPSDRTSVDPKELSEKYPQHKKLIVELTSSN